MAQSAILWCSYCMYVYINAFIMHIVMCWEFWRDTNEQTTSVELSRSHRFKLVRWDRLDPFSWQEWPSSEKRLRLLGFPIEVIDTSRLVVIVMWVYYELLAVFKSYSDSSKELADSKAFSFKAWKMTMIFLFNCGWCLGSTLIFRGIVVLMYH